MPLTKPAGYTTPAPTRGPGATVRAVPVKTVPVRAAPVRGATGRTPGTGLPATGFYAPGGEASVLKRAADVHRGAGPAWTPISAVLDYASKPASALAELASGHPLEAAKDVLNFAVPGTQAIGPLAGGDKRFSEVPYVASALGRLPGPARTVLAPVLDAATDPATYASFGAGAVAKTAGTEAAARLAEKIAQGEALTAKDIGRASLEAATERAAIPKAVRVNVRVPFSRARDVQIASSERLARAPAAIAQKVLPESVRARLAAANKALAGAFAPAAGTDKVVYRVGRDVANFGATQKRTISRAATQLDRAVRAAAKAAGVSEFRANELIATAVEEPDRLHTLPASLQPIVSEVRRRLDAYDAAEQAAGIEKGSIADYLPIRLRNARERKRFEREFGKTANLDNPFFVRERKFPTRLAAEAAGYKTEVNVARLLEVRGHASVDAITKKSFDDVIQEARGVKPPPVVRAGGPKLEPADPGYLARPGRATASKHDFAALTRGWEEFPSKYARGTRIDPATAEAVRRVHEQISPTVSTPEALQAIGQFANRITSRWKALALISPGFHARNAASDALSAWWAGGRNPQSYVQAARIMLGKGGRITIQGRSWGPEELLALARSQGVIDQGFSAKEIAAGLEEAGGSRLGRSRLRPAQPGTGRIAQASRRAGDFRENAMRLGTFIERLKAGDNAIEAGRVTREFHMDYGDVGRFVGQARRFWLPFITYPSKALPLVGRELVRHPGSLANLNATMQDLNQAAGSPDLSLLPVGSRSSFAIPLPSAVASALGGKPGQPLLYNPERVFSFGALNQFDPTQIQREGFGLLNPFVKAAYELPTNYRFYYAGPAAKRVRAPFLIQQAARLPGASDLLGIGPKRDLYTGQTVPGYSSTADYLLRLFPAFGQSAAVTPAEGNEGAYSNLVSYLTGIKLSPLDVQRQRYYAQRFGG